jgi:hypothetical protein
LKSKYKNAFTLTVILIWLAGMVVLAVPASAQTDGLLMKASAAYSGYYKYGEWLPVLVELENQGRDLEAEVQVQVNSSQGNLVFSAPVSLPSGSRKLVPVYVLANNFSRELDVRLVSGGQTVLSERTTVRPQPNISYFIGLVAPERGALALLSGIKPVGQERPKIVVDLPLAEIPGNAEALRSFDLIVLDDTDTSRLTPDQTQALASWVQQGGRLVIGGGAGAQRTLAGLPESLQPVQVRSTVEINGGDITALAEYSSASPILASGPFLAAQAEPVNSRVLIGSERLPLLFERPSGSGAVYFVALDLTGVPFNGWPGTQDFWQALLGSSASYPEGMPFDMSPRQFRANSLYYPLSNIPSLDLPSIRGVTILLILYILVVGPINYLVLRRMNRLHLAWVSIPIMTALFTLGSFGIGYTLRGNDLVLNKIAIVQVNPSGNAAVTTYMGLFSPRQQSYEVAVEGEGLLSPMTNYEFNPWDSRGMPANSGGEMVFIQDSPSKVKGLTVNQWAMQSFMSEGIWNNFGSFTGDLTLQNDVLVGKVRNESTFTLVDVVVTMNNRFVRLGDMLPGEEREVNLGVANVQSDRFGPQLSYRLFQDRFNTGSASREIEMKSNIISSVFENGMWAKEMPSFGVSSGSSTGVLIFGWLDQAPPAVSVANTSITDKTTALVYTSLNFKYPQDGIVALSPGMIPGRIAVMPQEGGTCGWGTSVHMARGQSEFEYTVPSELIGHRVQSLKLSLWRDNTGLWSMPEISIYDWTTENWTIIQEPIQGINVIEQASGYVSENGLIRVRLVSTADTFGCIYIDMGLEAERVSGQEG